MTDYARFLGVKKGCRNSPERSVSRLAAEVRQLQSQIVTLSKELSRSRRESRYRLP